MAADCEAAVVEMENPASAAVAEEPSSEKTTDPVMEKTIEENDNFNSEMSEKRDDGVKNHDVSLDEHSKSQKKMNEIVDLLKKLKLNPMAKEFFPSSYYHGEMVALSLPVDKNLGNDCFPNGNRRIT